MSIDLADTNAGAVQARLLEARRRQGSIAYNAVLTLVVATDEQGHYDALRAAAEASREHPARILVVVPRRTGRGTGSTTPPRLDAELRGSGDDGPGELVVLRLHGPLADHADSVALPLLLPDAPVVVWWPGPAPAVPAEDPLGRLAQRRVTDAAAAEDPTAVLAARARGYRPGDTDLAWSRLTSWRSLLASALDSPSGSQHSPVTAATVAAEAGNPSAALLTAWLSQRLDVPATARTSDGPGITEVRLTTDGGDISVLRPDGRLATLSRPGWPERPVALERRAAPSLLAEELRRLDADQTYAGALDALDAVDALGGLASPVGT